MQVPVAIFKAGQTLEPPHLFAGLLQLPADEHLVQHEIRLRAPRCTATQRACKRVASQCMHTPPPSHRAIVTRPWGKVPQNQFASGSTFARPSVSAKDGLCSPRTLTVCTVVGFLLHAPKQSLAKHTAHAAWLL